MRSRFFSVALLALVASTGCGGSNGIPRPEDTPGWDPVTAYVSAIKRETLAVAKLADGNPREASAQADAALENFQDTADTGQYKETVAEIKTILKALATGKGKATGLKELAEKLPGEVPGKSGKK